MDEHDDKVFNFLISRVSSRESASIAVVTLASSASLIFLGFTLDNFHWEFFFIGILFPSLAFLYNEITNRGLHQDDQNRINEMLKELNSIRWERETKDIIKNKNMRIERRIIMRFCFLSPILGWLLLLPIHFQDDMTTTIIIDIAFIGDIFFISYLTGKIPKEKSTER